MGCGASKSSAITPAGREPEPFKQQAPPIKLSSSPEKRPLPMLGNEAPLPQIGGKPSSPSSLPPLTQQRITRSMFKMRACNNRTYENHSLSDICMYVD